MKIRESRDRDFKDMIKIARSLHPKWFDNFAIGTSLPIDLKIHKGFAAEDKGKIVGFITYSSDEGQVKISWIGVYPEFQRKGIGSKLVKTLEKKLKKFKIKELRVKTVAETIKYEPYDLTRDFYKKMGFFVEKIEKVKSKDNGEEFDMVTFVKKL